MAGYPREVCEIRYPLIPDWELKPITVEWLLEHGFVPHEQYDNTWVRKLSGGAEINVHKKYETNDLSLIYTNSVGYPIVGLTFKICGQLYDFIKLHP